MTTVFGASFQKYQIIVHENEKWAHNYILKMLAKRSVEKG